MYEWWLNLYTSDSTGACFAIWFAGMPILFILGIVCIRLAYIDIPKNKRSAEPLGGVLVIALLWPAALAILVLYLLVMLFCWLGTGKLPWKSYDKEEEEKPIEKLVLNPFVYCPYCKTQERPNDKNACPNCGAERALHPTG